ncbi:MAG: hypothetical protein GYB67_03705 [Chloroflexi bacterium]|nr:hypothetical protein [Chloroflexota bacterium]
MYNKQDTKQLEAVQAADHAHIFVSPALPRHADQIERLQYLVYDLPTDCDDCLTAAHYRAQIERFPAGQFVARTADTHEVVGYTACMRFDFDPSKPLTETWDHTTGFG